ncbi:unknown [Tannerella sp. CAG:118]|nr:unknown [Tannerella sp. CAG:118]
MLEPERQPINQRGRYRYRFAVEADSVKPVCSQRKHVFLSARDKQRVAFGGQLLQPETVVFTEAAAIEEAGRGERAVQLDVLFALVAVHGFCH